MKRPQLDPRGGFMHPPQPIESTCRLGGARLRASRSQAARSRGTNDGSSQSQNLRIESIRRRCSRSPSSLAARTGPPTLAWPGGGRDRSRLRCRRGPSPVGELRRLGRNSLFQRSVVTWVNRLTSVRQCAVGSALTSSNRAPVRIVANCSWMRRPGPASQPPSS